MEAQHTSNKAVKHLAETPSDQGATPIDEDELAPTVPLKIEDWLTVIVTAS
ncbi:MAG: hypothetical protein IH612_21475, partial [Desulfofustis sp.]|nr:hypothetical protein [Desulfofustis sp.]